MHKQALVVIDLQNDITKHYKDITKKGCDVRALAQTFGITKKGETT